MKNRKSFIILSALVFLFFALNVDASNYWVRPTGTMSGCTPSAAAPGTDSGYKATINDGIACLASGDSLFIRTGTYTESLTTVPPSGTPGAPTWIGRYNNETVTVVPASGQHGIGVFQDVSYITYDGLILDGVNQTSSDGTAAGFSLCCYGGGAHPTNIVFQNGQIQNFTGLGVEMFSNSNIVRNSIINNNALCTLCPTGQAHAFYVSSDSNLFENNQVYDNGGYGFHIYGNDPNTSNNIVRNNRIYNNGRLSSQGGSGGFGILLSGGANNTAYNNLVYHNGRGVNFGGGIQIDYGCSSCAAYNNFVYDNASEGIAINANSSNTQVKNNISFGNGGVGIDDKSGSTTQTNNLQANPGVVDLSGANFHLTAGSTTAINKGATLSQVTTDFDGVTRPQGIAYDIGPYEYGGTVSTPGSLQFSSATYSVNESGGTATITVTRTGGTSGIVGATVSTSDGSATAGADYTTTSTAVSFANGSATSQTVSIPITDDSDVEGSETINLTLNAPTGGATLGSPASAVLTIVDNDAPTPSGITGLWTFNEASGTAGDTSGSSNTGTLTNGATRTAGIAGNALLLDGVDDYVTVADASSLDFNSTFTLLAWVSPASAYTDYRALIVKNYVYGLYASSQDYCGAGGTLGFFSDGVNFGTVCHATPLPLSPAWTLLTLVKDGTGLKLYKNATLVASSSTTASIPNSTGTLQIGASEWGENFGGKVDDARVYNTALTQAEILAIYNSVGVGSLAAPSNLVVK